MKLYAIKKLGILVLATLLWAPFQASALEIKFAAKNIGGSNWKLDYTLTAQAGDPTIDEVTIFFDRSRYGELSLLGSPAGWDSIVIQADPILSADGFVDTLALGGGLAPGDELTGLSIFVVSLVPGAPMGQLFQIIDPNTFGVVGSGLTIATDDPEQSISEPSGLALSALALLALRSAGRRKSRKGA